MKVDLCVKKPDNPDETVKLTFMCSHISLMKPFKTIAIYGIATDAPDADVEFIKPILDHNLQDVLALNESFGYIDVSNGKMLTDRYDSMIEMKDIDFIGMS